MAFEVGAEAYGRFMGRYADPLAVQLAGLAGVRPGQRGLDVGCGPGAMTGELVRILGADAVAAVDPSESFVAAAARRFPGVDVRVGVAEDLPYGDGTFDAVLAQLVVHFMTDPVAGISEMARVARAGGVVAASVWDHGGGAGPLSTFWSAVRELDPGAHDESDLPGAREGHLAELFGEAGLTEVSAGSATVTVGYASVEEWWAPFTLGVGPAGDYVRGLDDAHREALRERCAERLPHGPVEISATAWCVRAVV